MLLFSCDKIKPPYTVQHNNQIDTGQQHIKKILVEDYTGHLCPNCPAASDLLLYLDDTVYAGQIVTISLHVGGLAIPIAPTYYGEDFRTTEGEEINTLFGNGDAGLPNGFVNRRAYSGNMILSSSQWASSVQEILEEPQSMDFVITNTFDTATFKLNTKIDITFLQDFTESLYLCVYLTEDSLIGWQKDNRVNPEDVQDYVFHHVMRGSLNGTWGEKIKGTTSMNNTLTMECNNFQLDTSYKPVHCDVVVFAYDSTTYEIFQADEKPVLGD